MDARNAGARCCVYCATGDMKRSALLPSSSVCLPGRSCAMWRRSAWLAPVYTRQGRHGGGVYLVDGYVPERLYLSTDELSLLSSLLERADALPGFPLPG